MANSMVILSTLENGELTPSIFINKKIQNWLIFEGYAGTEHWKEVSNVAGSWLLHTATHRLRIPSFKGRYLIYIIYILD